MPTVSAIGGGVSPRGAASCTMSTSSAVSAGGRVQARAGEMLAPKRRPRCRSGMGVAVFEGKAGEGEVLGCFAGRTRPDQRVVTGASVAQCVTTGFDGMVLVPSLCLASGRPGLRSLRSKTERATATMLTPIMIRPMRWTPLVADAVVEDDAGDGGGGDGADVAKGAEQSGCDAELLAWGLGVEGDLVAAGGGG